MTNYPQTEALILKAIEEGKYRVVVFEDDYNITWGVDFPGDNKRPAISVYESLVGRDNFAVFLKRRFWFNKYLFTTDGETSSRIKAIIYSSKTRYLEAKELQDLIEETKEDSRIAKLMEGRL